MQNILCCFGTANPLSVSSIRSSRLLLSRRRTSIAIQAAPTVCSWAGRLLPAGLQNTLLVHLIHSSKPHHTPPAGLHLPPPAGLQINILIARLIYTASRSSLGRGRTSSLVRAASHTTPLCGSNHSLLPHP